MSISNKQIHEELVKVKEDLRDKIKPQIVEGNSSSLKEEIMGKEPFKENFKHKSFTNNQTLNDLLNETAQGDTNLSGGASPVSMEGEFSNIGGIPKEAAPKAVVEAVNRDYSGLMKAIDKKKNVGGLK